jgi:hypothetical protein
VSGKINADKPHSGNIYIFYSVVFGNESDNPADFLFLIRLMEKTDVGAAYGGPSAACGAGVYDKHI